MANRKIPYKKLSLPISQQVVAMEKIFPHFQAEWRRNTVTWTGTIQPTPLSNRYTIQITFSITMIRPKVIVLSPELRKRGNERIPHVYPGNQLCLFLPKNKEWTKNMLISDTIIPWTSLWLYYYEMWQSTGEWLGGGEHPQFRRKKHKRKRG